MKFLALLLLCAVAANGQYRKNLIKRQDVGYTASIFHGEPGQPDSYAQSTVNVNFNGQQGSEESEESTWQNGKQNNYQNYQSRYINKENPEMQLINVGYTVNFNGKHGNGKPNQAAAHTQSMTSQRQYSKNLDNAEIITGTRKKNEIVSVPNASTMNSDMSPEQFVSHALLEKTHKISGIKPKQFFSQPYNAQNTQQLLSKANLSPTTQKYLKALENTRVSTSPNTELIKKYSWQKISPSVEIVKSAEVPVGNRFTSTNNNNGNSFNHIQAIIKSQPFDYNSVEGNDGYYQNYQQLPAASYHQEQKTSFDSFGPQNLPAISNHLPTESTIKPSDLPQITIPTPSPIFGFKPSAAIPSNYQQDNAENVGHLPAIPKLPIDTSLLRDPVITTDSKEVHSSENHNLIPIHFDVRPIQQAIQSPVQQNYQQSGHLVQLPAQGSLTNTHQQQSSPHSSKSYQFSSTSPYAYQLYNQPHHQNYHKPTQYYHPAPQKPVKLVASGEQYDQFTIYGKPQPLPSKSKPSYYKVAPRYATTQREPRYSNERHSFINLRPPPYALKHRYQHQRRSYINYH